MKETNLAVVAQSMSSLQIAEITGKQHAHVMRDIRNMIEAVKKINESTSGFVGSEYHRGNRTQYKYLSERTQNILLDFATGKNTTQYIITEASYVDAKGETRGMYNLNKKACLLLASGYDVILRAKIIDRWEQLESGAATPIGQASPAPRISDRIQAAKFIASFLNLNDASKLLLAKSIADPLGLPTPDYTPSKGILRSARELLKEHGSALTSEQFNKRMIERGMMTELTRPSSKGGVKKFKSIIGDGLLYGENQVNPQNPKSTQPLYYADSFGKLLAIVANQTDTTEETTSQLASYA